MQAGETRMGFPGGQSRLSPLEVHRQRAQLSALGAGVVEIPSTAGVAAPATAASANGDVTVATTTTNSTCYDNINSQQLIYSTDQQPQQQQQQQQQEVGAPSTNNFQHHVTRPQVTSAHGGHHEHEQRHQACPALHQHIHQHQHQHDTSTNESYLHLNQGSLINHQHHHQNLVRKHQNKHPSYQRHLKHTSSSGATKAKQQIAEYAVQQATAVAAAAASQQSLLATRTTTAATVSDGGGGGACSPVMLSSPGTTAAAATTTTCLVTGDGGVASPQRSTIPMPQYAPQPRARVNSISAPRRQVTPTSYSPTPQTAAAHVRSLSFSSASASDALHAARGQLQPTSGSGELCCMSDTSASYQTQMATINNGDIYVATGGYRTPSLLSSSACSSIGSPARPASLLNVQQSPSPAPPPATCNHSVVGSGGDSILYSNSNQLYSHTTSGPVYQHNAQQANQHSYGGGNSSAPSGGSSTISASDSLNMSINLEQYISKRNERERSRVRNVNDAFDHLKSSLPLEVEKMSKRMSKVEILRTAIGYIRDLESILGCSAADQQQRAPSGGNRNRQHSFGANSERGHEIVASAKALRREFGSGQTGLLVGENRAGNFAELRNFQQQHQQQHQRQPFQPDLNHNNHYSYQNSYTLHNSNGFREYAGPAKSGAHDCRHDQQQQQQIMMNFEEY